MKRLILASASPRRRELLSQAGLKFEVMPSDKEEITDSKLPEEMVMQLAKQKAEDICQKLQGDKDTWIIGADTVVSLDHIIFGKPADEEDALRMLGSLQGRTHQVYTGVCLIHGDKKHTFFEKTDVTMYDAADSQLMDYIHTGEPMDKAGAYGIQGRGAVFIRGIQGDYNNVVGLPLARVWRYMADEDGLCFSRN